jgi:hypothetical protein
MNTCTAKAWNKPLLPSPGGRGGGGEGERAPYRARARKVSPLLLLPLLLAACTQDTASYTIGGDRQHSILLIRNQTWFWDNKVKLTIAPARLPDCQSSLTVEGVPKSGDIELYRAPDEYAEPLYIIKTGDRLFAVSTASCRVQPFETAPAQLGQPLGTFSEQDGVFGFRAGGAPEDAG